jgi:pimeloyl-ACP methyl ester carboxylesterase
MTDEQRRRRAGVLAAAAMAQDYAGDLVVGTTRDVHAAVSSRVFGLVNGATGGAARTPQAVHDLISDRVYSTVHSGVHAAAEGIRALEDQGVGPRLESNLYGRQLLAAVNGLVGDRLARDHPRMAIPLAVRRDGADVPLTTHGLAEAFPRATGKLVVFVHGLAENEESWELGAEDNGGSYGARLDHETDWTSVYVRINTGLRLAENGAGLASLLDDLVAAWPTDVERLALVGHSMGGLLIRAACAVDSDAGTPWQPLVSNVVTLGTPHLGAPLERLVAGGSRMLRRLPESAPFGRLLEYRSRGILDLSDGLSADVQHLPHARYHLVAATLTDTVDHPVGRVLGDLLVRFGSATARSRRREMFPGADVLHVPGADHFALLNHPTVYEALRRWLA